MSVHVCKDDDEYVRDRLRWVVELNNRERIIEDDDRPGVFPPSAWRRLSTYCNENDLFITRMWFQFRSHCEEVAPPLALGYYFAKAAMATLAAGDGQGVTYYAYVGGHLLDDGRVRVTKWLTPSLIPLETSVRTVGDWEKECLICLISPGG